MNEEKLIGTEVNIPIRTREDFSLFSESQSRVIVSVKTENKKKLEDLLKEKNQHFLLIGNTKANGFKVNNEILLELDELAEIYYSTIPRIMNA